MRTVTYGMLVLAIGWLAIANTAVAEDYSISRHELLSRIEQAEAELAAMNQAGAVNYGGGCDAGCNSCCDCCSGGWYALYENVILQPYFTQNNAYYLDRQGALDGQQAVPFDWDYEYSPRIELGYMSDCGCVGWRVRYWKLDVDTATSVYTGNGNVYADFNYDSVPASGEIGFNGVDGASFTHSLELDVLDLEFAFRECDWTYSAGFRYARMEQVYTGFSDDNPQDSPTAGHDFDAYGLTAAAEVVKPWCGALSVFAKVRGSALYGDSSWFAINQSQQGLHGITNEDDLMAVGEFQAGLLHRTCLDCNRVFYMTLAFEAQYWLNAGTGGPISNAVFDEGNYQNGNPIDADLGLLGGTFGLGLLY